eukprot:315090-Rhodomonas_salina.1
MVVCGTKLAQVGAVLEELDKIDATGLVLSHPRPKQCPVLTEHMLQLASYSPTPVICLVRYLRSMSTCAVALRLES